MPNYLKSALNYKPIRYYVAGGYSFSSSTPNIFTLTKLMLLFASYFQEPQDSDDENLNLKLTLYFIFIFLTIPLFLENFSTYNDLTKKYAMNDDTEQVPSNVTMRASTCHKITKLLKEISKGEAISIKTIGVLASTLLLIYDLTNNFIVALVVSALLAPANAVAQTALFNNKEKNRIYGSNVTVPSDNVENNDTVINIENDSAIQQLAASETTPLLSNLSDYSNSRSGRSTSFFSNEIVSNSTSADVHEEKIMNCIL